MKSTAAQPFQHVRKGFRNQSLDPVNTHLDIMTSRLSEPLVCHWPNVRGHTTPAHRVARVFPVPSEDADQKSTDKAASVSSRVAGNYNELSKRLHRNDSAVDASSEQTFDVQLEKGPARPSQPPANQDSWVHEDVLATIDGHRLSAVVVAQPRQLANRSLSQTAEAIHMMCHFPVLGDWVDFKMHSPLTFHESLRQTVAAGSDLAVKQLFAPMPCKVVTVLKKTGEVAKTGDLVLVVESMKMEINMAISAAGKMKMYVEPGQALEEGTLLCEVE